MTIEKNGNLFGHSIIFIYCINIISNNELDNYNFNSFS